MWNAKTVFVDSMSHLSMKTCQTGTSSRSPRYANGENWHTYQVLTKRSERLRTILATRLSFVADARHIWWGTSVEDKKDGGLPKDKRFATSSGGGASPLGGTSTEDLGEVDLAGNSIG